MKRTRPLSRIERNIEDAPARATQTLIAREVAITLARRWPHLSVEQAMGVLTSTRDVQRGRIVQLAAPACLPPPATSITPESGVRT